MLAASKITRSRTLTSRKTSSKFSGRSRTAKVPFAFTVTLPTDNAEVVAKSFFRRCADWCLFFILWLVPLCVYYQLSGRWCLSGDEFYTYVDSSKPISELLSYERKPLYYMICHGLLQLNLGLPVEVVLRLPAVIAASLTPALLFIVLRHKRYANIGLLASLFALFSPWLFAMSQYARFYSLAFMFATLTVLAGLRSVHAPRKGVWIVLMMISGFLAAISQIPAGIVVPASLVGLAIASFRENPAQANESMRKYGPFVLVGCLLAAVAGYFALRDVFVFWMSSNAGEFGTYTVPQLLMAIAGAAGIGCWALAFLPLLRPPISWSPSDIYLAVTTLLSGFPLMIFIPFGGGVSSNYLMFCMPSLFILAAIHWRQIDERLPSWGYRIALGVGVLAFNVPYLFSTAVNGNHYDYRKAAQLIDEMELENPVIVSSGHRLLNMYLTTTQSELDLGTFDQGVQRDLVENGIKVAVAESRPLLLVSRETRHVVPNADQVWLHSRFALIKSIETPGYDHRRRRVSIYEYRPATELNCEREFRTSSADAAEDPDASLFTLPPGPPGGAELQATGRE